MRPQTAFIIVSQSQTLARGVCEVVSTLAPEVIVEPCGCHDEGLGTASQIVTTQVSAVMEKISEQGAIVLMADFGAARLACQRATPEEMEEILACGEAVDQCIRQNQDRTAADREFHAAIVRATHNSFMMRLLPMINQAVAAAIVSGQHKDQLAEDTRRDHALLMDFFRKRDADGAAHAMAIHMHHSIDVMGLEE